MESILVATSSYINKHNMDFVAESAFSCESLNSFAFAVKNVITLEGYRKRSNKAYKALLSKTNESSSIPILVDKTPKNASETLNLICRIFQNFESFSEDNQRELITVY